MICLTESARTALHDDEALVFDYVRLAMCCASAGEVSLRLAPRHTVSATYRPLPMCGAESHPVVLAHPMAYQHLVQRDVIVDQHRLLGVRRFVTDLPPDFGLRAALGRPAPAPVPPDPANHVHQSLHGGAR